MAGIDCCKDDDPGLIAPIDQLPPLTMEGKNTFGCLVNGKAFVPRLSTSTVGIYQGGSLQVGGNIEDAERDQNISIILEDIPIAEATYQLTKDFSRSAEFSETAISPWCLYEYDDLVEGVVNIVFFRQDPDIVAGTFEFVTVNDDCDTIRITDGRFDIDFIQ